MSAKYVIRKDQSGQYSFVLKADNGATILSSESYTTKLSVLNGIESVRVNGKIESRFEIRKASNGSYYFALKAANHQIIGISEFYTTRDAVQAAVESVRNIAAGAGVLDFP